MELFAIIPLICLVIRINLISASEVGVCDMDIIIFKLLNRIYVVFKLINKVQRLCESQKLTFVCCVLLILKLRSFDFVSRNYCVKLKKKKKPIFQCLERAKFY